MEDSLKDSKTRGSVVNKENVNLNNMNKDIPSDHTETVLARQDYMILEDLFTN